MRDLHSQRRPLFPGNSCYPLSPLNKEGSIFMDPWDQTALIIEILGSPKTEDLEFIEKPSAKSYLESFPYKEPVDLRTLFFGIEDSLFILLRSMLEFNPKNRPTLEILCSNILFSAFKGVDPEYTGVKRRENECKIDFETHKFFLDQQDLWFLFLREMASFGAKVEMHKWNEYVEALLEHLK